MYWTTSDFISSVEFSVLFTSFLISIISARNKLTFLFEFFEKLFANDSMHAAILFNTAGLFSKLFLFFYLLSPTVAEYRSFENIFLLCDGINCFSVRVATRPLSECKLMFILSITCDEDTFILICSSLEWSFSSLLELLIARAFALLKIFFCNVLQSSSGFWKWWVTSWLLGDCQLLKLLL